MDDSNYTIDDFKKIERPDFTEDELFSSSQQNEESRELTESYDSDQGKDGTASWTDGINFEEFKGIHEIETKFSSFGVEDDDDDEDCFSDVGVYPKMRTSIYYPPLPKKRTPFYKKNKTRHRITWDYDKNGTEFMEFPSEWTEEDEKIFYEKALPEYRANLKNRKKNMEKMYAVPNTWKKKVYGNIKIEEFGQPRPDPLMSGAVEKEIAIKRLEELDSVLGNKQ